MSCHTVHFTMYRMAKTTLSLSLSLSLSLTHTHTHIQIFCPLICKKVISSNREVNKQCGLMSVSFYLIFQYAQSSFFKYILKPDLKKPFYIEGRRWEIQSCLGNVNERFQMYHKENEEIYQLIIIFTDNNAYCLTSVKYPVFIYARDISWLSGCDFFFSFLSKNAFLTLVWIQPHASFVFACVCFTFKSTFIDLFLNGIDMTLHFWCIILMHNFSCQCAVRNF